METPMKGLSQLLYEPEMSLDIEFLQFTKRTTLQAMKEVYRKNYMKDAKQVFDFDIKVRKLS